MHTDSYAHNEKASRGQNNPPRRMLRERMLAGEDIPTIEAFANQAGGCNGNFTDPVTGEARLVTISCHPVIQCRSPGRQIIGGASVI